MFLAIWPQNITRMILTVKIVGNPTYTVSQKSSTQTHGDNFVNLNGFLKILSLLETEVNFQFGVLLFWTQYIWTNGQKDGFKCIKYRQTDRKKSRENDILKDTSICVYQSKCNSSGASTGCIWLCVSLATVAFVTKLTGLIAESWYKKKQLLCHRSLSYIQL